MDDTGDIERYLSKKDPSLGRVIKIVRAARGELLRPLPSTDNPFQALVRAVIYQRGSEASGATVFSRLKGIAGGTLTPAKNTVSIRQTYSEGRAGSVQGNVHFE